MEYRDFLSRKHRRAEYVGHDVPDSAINPMLFDWQQAVVRWTVRCGRAALFEDCGLGKTPQQLAWAELVARRTGKPVLILCPIAVAQQTLREAGKFKIGVDVRIIANGGQVDSGINICNYEKLHLLYPKVFGGVVLDESSILKSFMGKTKQALCQSFRDTPYKLACTATPAPNDRMELGNHSDFLGVMPSDEMLSRWFINDTMKAGGYRLRRHARGDFWNWCSSWAVCITKPSDLGYSDEGYELPPLNVVEHVIVSDQPPPGMLFYDGPGISATNVHREKRRALDQRAAVVGGLVAGDTDAWAVWCDTDYEADALKAVIPGAVEVRGSQPEKKKEEGLNAFSTGQARVIITKPEIGGLGLNWQHAHKTTWFAGYSFEKFYQAIRRLYRFGQKRQVDCHVVMSEAEQSIAETVKRKQREHAEMFSEMAREMRAGSIERICGVRKLQTYQPTESPKVPAWLTERAVA